MPPIAGMRGTEQLAPDQRRIDMSKQIKMLVPDETPFTTFLQSLSKTRTTYPEFKALEDDVLPRFDARRPRAPAPRSPSPPAPSSPPTTS